MYNNNKIVSWKQIELSKKEHNILTWRCPLVEHEETLEALILLPCSLGSSSWFLWIDGTASTFKAVLGINGVPGIDINLFSKSSALKCSEHSREFAVGDHRFVRTKLAHSHLRFFSDSLSLGNLWSLMFLEASGTFEHPPVTHLYGIFSFETRHKLKKNTRIVKNYCLMFTTTKLMLCESVLLLLRHWSRTSSPQSAQPNKHRKPKTCSFTTFCALGKYQKR